MCPLKKRGPSWHRNLCLLTYSIRFIAIVLGIQYPYFVFVSERQLLSSLSINHSLDELAIGLFIFDFSLVCSPVR